MNDVEIKSTLQEMYLFMSFGLIVFILYSCIDGQIITVREFLEGVLGSAVLLSLLVIIFFLISELFDVNVMANHFLASCFFNNAMASATMHNPNALLKFENGATETVIAIVLSFVAINFLLLPLKLRVCTFIFLSIMLLLTVSRLYWFAAVCCWVLFLIYNIKHKWVWALLCISVIAIIIFRAPLLEILHYRYIVYGEHSDLARWSQFNHLISTWRNAPLFGHGLGAHAAGYLRDTVLLFDYEMQWLILFLQLGLIGGAILVTVFILPILSIFRSTRRYRWALLGAYGFYLMTGWLEPYLLSTQTAIIYALFLVINKMSPITYEKKT